jgi:hypothetical protein
MSFRRRMPSPRNWDRIKRKLDAQRHERKRRMTICIAATCKHEGKPVMVLCADYQGTRGDYIKADDTYKLWHFREGGGAILFAGDIDVGKEFVRRFTAVTREFAKIKKTKGDGDMDLRVGLYLAKVRALVREFIKERTAHLIATKYGIDLGAFYSPNAPSTFLTTAL